MKNLITILILFAAVGCGKSETKTEIIEKPLSPEEEVVGSYEAKISEGKTLKVIFFENGKLKSSKNEKKKEGIWKIVGNEVHVGAVDSALEEGKSSSKIEVLKIEPNGDLTLIADIRGGKRKDIPKEKHITVKIIK